MSLLSNSQLPVGFTTVEQLAIYTGAVFAALYPNDKYLLNSQTAEKHSDIAIITSAEGLPYFITRMVIPLDGTYNTSTTPIWTKGLEIGNVTVPTRFRATT